jgi:hypothetical protein
MPIIPPQNTQTRFNAHNLQYTERMAWWKLGERLQIVLRRPVSSGAESWLFGADRAN